jgi:hypothetical protein
MIGNTHINIENVNGGAKGQGLYSNGLTAFPCKTSDLDRAANADVYDYDDNAGEETESSLTE